MIFSKSPHNLAVIIKTHNGDILGSAFFRRVGQKKKKLNFETLKEFIQPFVRKLQKEHYQIDTILLRGPIPQMKRLVVFLLKNRIPVLHLENDPNTAFNGCRMTKRRRTG